MINPRTWWLVGLFLLGSRCLPAQTAAHLLLVTVDTWRYDRSSLCGEDRVQLPNLDRIAAEGAVFRRAFAHAPMTLPSHASILTGLTPLRHGIGDNSGFRLDASVTTLAERLHEAGFATAAFVSSFVLDPGFGLDQGFDTYSAPAPPRSERTAGETVPLALEWLGRQKGRWFLWLHLWDPHAPYTPPAPYRERYRDDPYSGEVAYVDEQLGRLFDALRAQGVLDRTLLVVCGDHGESLGEHGELEHGFFAYNSTLHVPLLLRGPGIPRRIVPDPVSHIDLVPTVCSVVGVPSPAPAQGRSLLPLLGSRGLAERPIYFEAKGAFYTKGWAPLEGVIRGGRKYIDLPIREVYDLTTDFDETRNLISRVRQADFASVMKEARALFSAGGKRLDPRRTLSQAEDQKLRSLGYLSGVVQKPKARFGREDDLKVLLPVQNLLHRANQLDNQGRLEEAAGLYEQAIAAKPDNPGSYANLAELQARRGRLEEALALLRRGLAACGDNVELNARLGILLAESGAGAQALQVLQQVVRDNPQHAQAWNYIGVVRFRSREWEEAEQAYRRAIGIDPGCALAHSNLGALLLTRFIQTRQASWLEEALASFNRALRFDTGLVPALNGKASALLMADRAEEAKSLWRRAIQLQRDYVDAYFNLAVACLQTGDQAAARETLSACRDACAARLTPAARQRLERLMAEAGG